jgi:hypothetical protein
MPSNTLHRFLAAALLASFCSVPALAGPVFQLIPPTGALGAMPGATVTWGLTVTDTGNEFVLLTDSLFTPFPPLGSYTDFIGAGPNLVVGPAPESSMLSIPQIGSFQLPANAPTGAVIAGTLSIDYSIFSQDPNDPSFDPGTFLSNATFTQRASVTVTPEPGTLVLLFGAALPLAISIRRRRS